MGTDNGQHDTIIKMWLVQKLNNLDKNDFVTFQNIFSCLYLVFDETEVIEKIIDTFHTAGIFSFFYVWILYTAL